jgi:hypothetical protein
MISIIETSPSFIFQIGKHQFSIKKELLISLSDVLIKDRITEMAELLNPWNYGDWTLEGAADDRLREPGAKWEFRKRVLLKIGSKKWHLTQEECIKLGDLCRNLLQTK